jgi:phage terminase large subunit
VAKRVNPNLRFLCQNLHYDRRTELIKQYESRQITFDQFKEICKQEDIPSGVLLKGSSRSGKTTSSIDFKTWLASKKGEKGTVNVIRETYNSFKTTLFDDYNKRLPIFGVNNPFAYKQDVASFKIFELKVNLLGADNANKFMGAGSDYVYFNEMLDIPKEVVNNAIMRCRKFWWGDFNPKYADHYVFNSIMSRDDVKTLTTTFRDNPFISPNERASIEAYQPVSHSRIAVFFGSLSEDQSKKASAMNKAYEYDLKINHLKFPQSDILELERCHYNERVGTANAYNWMVFGEGQAMAPEGLIFPHVIWVDKIPDHCEKRGYGLDFGYTESPSVLVDWGISGRNLYAKICFYQPTPSPEDLVPLLTKHITRNDPIWADPSGEDGGRGFISYLRKKGFQVYGANTYAGSRQFGIALLKKYLLHLVDCKPWRKEQLGYTKATAKVNGVKVVLDTPIDGNDHAWDALRISAIMNNL